MPTPGASSPSGRPEWYDGALVSVKRAGPYAVGDRSMFFGDGGDGS